MQNEEMNNITRAVIKQIQKDYGLVPKLPENRCNRNKACTCNKGPDKDLSQISTEAMIAELRNRFKNERNIQEYLTMIEVEANARGIDAE